jgi:hypothetical protein
VILFKDEKDGTRYVEKEGKGERGERELRVNLELGEVPHVCNPSTQVAEAGGSQV